MNGILRTFIGLEAVMFLLAAFLHSGLIFSEYQHMETMAAELVIAGVLGAGVALVSIYRARRRAIALGVHTFAIIGTITAASLAVAGLAPQGLLDNVLLGTMALVLLAGLLWTSRRLTGETAETVIISRHE